MTYKLVPIEPTREMTDAAEYLVRRHGEMVRGLGIWEAMLAAFPTPPILPNYREEVATALRLTDPVFKTFTMEETRDIADAAISTLQRLGWKLEQRDLLKRIEDAELALNIHDAGHTSEYWLRYPAKAEKEMEGGT